eukprot:2330240-Prymnesium_polylepis.2
MREVKLRRLFVQAVAVRSEEAVEMATAGLGRAAATLDGHTAGLGGLSADLTPRSSEHHVGK